MNSRPLPYQGSALPLSYTGVVGAEDEVRTRAPQLGRLMLYRLSYFRIFLKILPFQNKSPILFCRALVGEDGFEPPKVKTSRFTVCPIWPLWYSPKILLRTFEPMEGIEPTTPRLQITCSGQLSYIGNVFCFPSGRFVSQRDCKGRHYFLICKSFQSFFDIFSKSFAKIFSSSSVVKPHSCFNSCWVPWLR